MIIFCRSEERSIKGKRKNSRFLSLISERGRSPEKAEKKTGVERDRLRKRKEKVKINY